MKIILIYGDDERESEKYLVELIQSSRNKGLDFTRISYAGPRSLSEQLSSLSLFNRQSLFLLEDAGQISSKEINWLSKNYKVLKGDLVIYSNSRLPPLKLKSLFGIAEVKEFKLPKYIFAFLDSIVPQGARRAILYLHELIKKEAPEMIFAVLSRHIRDLYWVKVSPGSIPYPSWRVSRLQIQSRKFSEEKLRKIITALVGIDLASKSSKEDLPTSLDLLIATQLQ